MPRRHLSLAAGLAGCLTVLAVSVSSADPSYEQTARYILDVVKAFRTAYVLHVVEHTRGAGQEPREDWEQDAHFIPLPAQFVKAAAGRVETVEIGLISLTPINSANRPRTPAETNALMQLEKDRQQSFISFTDGDYFTAVSADLALVRSCVECHNQHPRSARKNYREWDVMGGLVVRFKRPADTPGLPLSPEPSPRPSGRFGQPAPPPTALPPWVR
jgi:Protein of unknown function (DUF3365)